MVIEPGVVVITEDGEMVVADGKAARCDDTLGEQSMMISTALTLLTTNVEMKKIESLPRGIYDRIATLVGCLNGCHMLPNSLCRGAI